MLPLDDTQCENIESLIENDDEIEDPLRGDPTATCFIQFISQCFCMSSLEIGQRIN